jgi:hypothetical protein
MPIEIRELVIKAEVNKEGASGTTAPLSGSNKGGKSNIDINEIVSMVFEKIKEKLER